MAWDHWDRLKVGIVFVILAAIMGWVLSAFLWPMWLAATVNTKFLLIATVLTFLVWAYAIGWLIEQIVHYFGLG